MLSDVRHIAIFEEVIRQGSFRAAARQLELSPSVVSYHINQLEQRLGTALIYRTTRKLSLTHQGELLFKHATQMREQTEQVLDEVLSFRHEPAGSISITLPAAATHAPITKRISQFLKTYPKINASISFTDTRQDLIADGIDLAIRAGDIADSSLKCKRVGEINRVLVCSPEVAEHVCRQATPDTLQDYDWIKLSMMPTTRTLINRSSKQKVELAISSRITVDSVEAMTRLSKLGLGLSTPPTYLVDASIASGELVEVLPDWQVAPIPLYAIWPNNASPNSVTKRLIDFISD